MGYSNNTNKKWIKAGIILAKNPSLKVLCPECKSKNLEVLDIMNKDNPSASERIIYCPSCKAKNILRLKL